MNKGASGDIEAGGDGSLRRYVRQTELLRTLGVSRPTLWEWRRSGNFPQPVRLGPGVIAWPLDVIEHWLSTRPAA